MALLAVQVLDAPPPPVQVQETVEPAVSGSDTYGPIQSPVFGFTDVPDGVAPVQRW